MIPCKTPPAVQRIKEAQYLDDIYKMLVSRDEMIEILEFYHEARKLEEIDISNYASYIAYRDCIYDQTRVALYMDNLIVEYLGGE